MFEILSDAFLCVAGVTVSYHEIASCAYANLVGDMPRKNVLTVTPPDVNLNGPCQLCPESFFSTMASSYPLLVDVQVVLSHVFVESPSVFLMKERDRSSLVFAADKHVKDETTANDCSNVRMGNGFWKMAQQNRSHSLPFKLWPWKMPSRTAFIDAES